MELIQFTAQIATDETSGELRARIVPFDQAVPYGRGTVQFAKGSLTVPDVVPMTIDHGDSVLDRIGVMDTYLETDEAGFASLRFLDTERAQDVRTIIESGAVADVSIGVADYTTEGNTDVVMSGTLDHVSIVTHGRFSRTPNHPAKILSVHQEGEPMEDTNMEAMEAPTTTVVEFDDSHLIDEIKRLADDIDALKPTTREARFSADQVADAAIAQIFGMPQLSEHALADVIGDLGSADASGLQPDYYWPGGLQQNIDRRRPLFAAGGMAEFPTYGNTLASARVTQEVAVGSGTAQKAEVASQALQVIPTSFPIVWHKGAVDVAMELELMSSPDVRRVIRDSFWRQYAIATNTDAYAKLSAVATPTGAALDTSSYGAFVAQIIDTSNLIEDATGLPGNFLAVTPAEWGAILALTDGDDRRQFAVNSPSNADGAANLTVRSINIAGVNVFRDYSTTVATQFNQESFRKAERNPIEVAVTNVAKMGTDRGIIGASVIVHWAAGIYDYAAA